MPLSGGTERPVVPAVGGDGALDARPLQTLPLTPRVEGAPTLSAERAYGTAPIDPDDAQRLVGRVLAGRYEVRGLLGRGGMGIVYVGRHITVNRPVAIKVLRRDLARSTQAAARFHREAQAAAAGGSEHIVEVFDFGYSDDGDAFLVMELLEGEDLARLLRREGPLPEARALEVARQIARALACAHAKGIIHRDLKSENVFVLRRDGADFVKLVDFGISKMAEGDDGTPPMTMEGVLMGTPHYMAPEQAVGELEPDHRIDVYSLGCILFEMLTGRVPFSGRNPVEVVFKHVHEAPAIPSRLRAPDGAISPETDALVARALAKDRDARFGSALEFLAALPHATAAGSELAGRTSTPGGAARTSATSEPDEISLVREQAASDSSGDVAPTVVVPARRAHPTRIVAIAAVGAALLIVGAVRLVRRASAAGEPGHAAAASIAVVGAPRAGQPERAGPDASTAHPEPAPDPSGAGPAAPASPPGVAARESLEVHVAPRTAVISIDGTPVATGDLRREFPAGSRHRVEITADGFERESEDVVLDRPVRRTVRLARSRAALTHAASSSTGDGAASAAVRADAALVAAPGSEDRSVDRSDDLHGNPYEERRRP